MGVICLEGDSLSLRRRDISKCQHLERLKKVWKLGVESEGTYMHIPAVGPANLKFTFPSA